MVSRASESVTKMKQVNSDAVLNVKYATLTKHMLFILYTHNNVYIYIYIYIYINTHRYIDR